MFFVLLEMPQKPAQLKRSAAQRAAVPVVPQKKSTPEKNGERATNGKENASRNFKASVPDTIEQMNFEYAVLKLLIQLLSFRDESASLASSAIENYFMQGKTAAEKMNTARVRRGRRAEAIKADDEEDRDVDEMIADFTKCDLAGLRDYIANQDDSKFAKQLEYLKENEFNKWTLYLASGFNILLHGVGSKREVVTEFIEQELEDFTYMRVDARKEGLNPKILLSSINDIFHLNCNVS